jgi:hypothetical protein
MKKLIIVVLFVAIMVSCIKEHSEPYLKRVEANKLDDAVVMDNNGDMYVLKWEGFGNYAVYQVDTTKVTTMLKALKTK